MPIHVGSLSSMATYHEKPLPDICTMFLAEFYQHFQALRFALEEINGNPTLLPNKTLGFYVYDSCAALRREIEGTLWILTGKSQAIPNYSCREKPPLTAIIGHSKSTYSILMAHILGLYKYPQISYYSTSSLLSDRAFFPSFFRTVPSDAFQFRGLAKLVLHFKWTWVGLIATNDDYGNEAIKTINEEIIKGEACVAYTLYITSNLVSRTTTNIVNIIKESSANVVIAISVGAYLAPILEEMLKQNTPRSVCSQSCPVGFKKLVKRGEPVCCFQCVPCAQGEVSNQTDSIECWKCPWDMWPNSKRDKCFLKLTEFLSYEDPLGLILAAVSAFSSMVPMSIFRLFFQYKSTPIVRANNYSVSCILLVSLSFCFLCALAFIGYPQPEKCLLRQAAFGLVFTLCVSCILAKTVIVVFAFMATKPGSSLKKWTTPRVPYMIITICTFIQLTLCVFWLTIFPPFLQFNIEAKPGIIIVECNENSQFAFWCMLGYLGILATVSFTVAFLARRLPDNFNEAKLITFSMLAFLSVWVYFIPASLSAQGKYTVAMEIFAILTSSWALVFCMFLPKCFIILFRPDMNSREKLMGK
eukprot:XP_012815741.1 PREDICTED: vomeronasal type-2 receptor 26-like [Xenopus tropicalis]